MLRDEIVDAYVVDRGLSTRPGVASWTLALALAGSYEAAATCPSPGAEGAQRCPLARGRQGRKPCRSASPPPPQQPLRHLAGAWPPLPARGQGQSSPPFPQPPRLGRGRRPALPVQTWGFTRSIHKALLPAAHHQHSAECHATYTCYSLDAFIAMYQLFQT
eukprot:scaffold686_cov342-Prasinococcus_capsulatus_cf.AAC.8